MTYELMFAMLAITVTALVIYVTFKGIDNP